MTRKYVRKKKPAHEVAETLDSKPSPKKKKVAYSAALDKISFKMNKDSKRTLSEALLAAQKAFDHEDKDFFHACRKAFHGEDISFRRKDFDVLDDKVHSTFRLTHGEETFTDDVSVNSGEGESAALALSLETWLRDFFLVVPREISAKSGSNIGISSNRESPPPR